MYMLIIAAPGLCIFIFHFKKSDKKMFPSQIICVRRVPLIVKSCVRSPKQIREYQNIVFQTIDPTCHCFTRQSVLWPLNEWWSSL